MLTFHGIIFSTTGGGNGGSGIGDALFVFGDSIRYGDVGKILTDCGDFGSSVDSLDCGLLGEFVANIDCGGFITVTETINCGTITESPISDIHGGTVTYQ